MKRLLGLILLTACTAPPPPSSPVVQPTVADVPIFFQYSGHVEPHQSVKVKAQVSGTITGKFFIEGQEVNEGDLLLTIDPRPYQVELDRAQGQLSQNLAKFQQTKKIAERYSQLIKDEYVSQLDYDKYLTDVYTAKAAVQESYAQVEKAQIDLDHCMIQAPFKGIASKLNIDVGNYVPSGGTDTLLTIHQISPIRVSFFVPKQDRQRIKELHHQKAFKTVALLNDESIEGNLTLIDNQVNNGTILLQALFTNADHKLWPGEALDVRLILEN